MSATFFGMVIWIPSLRTLVCFFSPIWNGDQGPAQGDVLERMRGRKGSTVHALGCQMTYVGELSSYF